MWRRPGQRRYCKDSSLFTIAQGIGVRGSSVSRPVQCSCLLGSFWEKASSAPLRVEAMCLMERPSHMESLCGIASSRQQACAMLARRP